MDVRCEKCLTVYELDDDKVGDAGLTVKCQECGNLFKVRRKAEPAAEPLDAEPDEASTDQRAIAPGRSPEPVAADKGWLLRSVATQDIVRFRELTTLQQWIVERKVTRKDEISRGGESWKALGGIAELASFFHVVEQAQSIADASQPGLAVQRANQTGGLASEQLAQLPTRPFSAQHAMEQDDGHDLSIDEERPDLRREGSSPLLAILFAVLAVAVLVSGYLVVWPRISGQIPASSASDTATQLALQGREAFLLDTDEGFGRAVDLLDRAIALDPTALSARVDLAEAHVTWAAYLLDDERTAEPEAARSLAVEARTHLERAHRVLEEPRLPSSAASPLMARALADLLRVENAPLSTIQAHLDRAVQTSPRDRELLYVRGELARREGKTTDALALLSEAATPDSASKPLLRAAYRYAQLALASKVQEDAARACAALKPVWATHDRARVLCVPEVQAPIDAATPVPKSDGGVASAPSIAPPGTVAPAPPKDISTMDYKALVQNADRLAVGGHSPQARKLYERALELEPKGLAALVGMGYCDLEAERYMQAVDRFNAALSVDPSSGEAMLGLAESYRVRGQSGRAIESYKRYLAQHPSGDKAQLAQKNIRDLEAKQAPVEKPAKPEGDSTAVTDKMTIKSQEAADEEPAAKDKDKTDVKLPRPPLEEPTP